MTRLLRASIVAVAVSLMWGCTSEVLVPDERAPEFEPVSVYGDPTVTLSVSPPIIASGGSATLTWSTTFATRCTASGGWTGSKATNGSQSTGVLTATTSFSLACSRWRSSRGWVTTSRTVTVTVSSVVPPPPPPPPPGIFPLRVEAGKRYLIDAVGRPFLIHGDAAWSLMVQLTRAEVDQYLEDRRLKGFNTILVNLLEHQYSTNPPNNVYGNGPFLTPGDFGTPNESYFAHVEYVIGKAAEKGILLLLTPAYMGSAGGSSGWYAEMTASGATTLRIYGQYLATRFRNYANIAWVHGGDFNPPERTLLRAVANGILDIDTKWLHTFHGPKGTAALEFLGTSEPWLTVNDIYTDALTVTSKAIVEYNRSTMPFFLIESAYENLGGTSYTVRHQAYQAVLSGAAGQVMGNDPVWRFGSGWSAALNSAGARTLVHLRALFEARSWWTLAPDVTHTLLTDGLGSGSATAAASLASDRAFALVYVPSVRNVTIDLAQVAGPGVTARWYDPTNGTFTTIAGSPFAASGANVFRPGSVNSVGQGDWVLVLESSTVGGTPAPTVTLSANPTSVASGGASALTWSSTNATGCIASGAWTGTKTTSGSESTAALSATASYTLTCTGPGGSAFQTATVAILPAASVTLMANPTSVGSGGSSVLTWSSTNATSCLASGGWSGVIATGGNQSTGPLTATTSYTLTCTGPGGSGAAGTTVAVMALPTGIFPLRREAGTRHLIDAQGRPFLIHGDTPWSLIVQLTRAEADQYLEDRRVKGFNTVLVNVIEHFYSASPPNNVYGDRPFLTAGDFATPNEAYFAHAAYVIGKAAEKGMLVLLTPAYMGSGGGNEGWYQEMAQNGGTKLRAYGQYLANRFRAFDNIVWVHGSDYNPPEKNLLRAIVNGILDVDTKWLHTFHGARGTAAMEFLGTSEAWLSVNNIYTDGSSIVSRAFQEYNRSTMPFFLIEAIYENEGIGGVGVRQQAYQAVLSGGAGQLMGNTPVWRFGSGWQTALNSAGARSLTHLRTLFEARQWATLVPDQSATVLTAGAQTGANRAVAARAANGSFALIYMPSIRSVTINLTQLAGPNVTARWYDPTNGAYVSVTGSPFAATGTRAFQPAGNNAGAAGDWVLVLESLTP